jgi:hypothetical protein
LKEAAEDYLKATGPYDAALQELRQFLLAAEPSELIAVELEHTERLIEALNKEKQVGSKLIGRHVEMNAQNLKPKRKRLGSRQRWPSWRLAAPGAISRGNGRPSVFLEEVRGARTTTAVSGR